MSASWLSVRSASLHLDGVSEREIRDNIAAGKLPAARFGKPPKAGHQDKRSIRIKVEDLDHWAESHKATA